MKAKQFLIPIIVFIALAGLLFGGLFVYKKFVYKDTSYVGKWTRQVDITEFVTDVMDVWLDKAIVGDLAEYGDERVYICINLTMNSNGSWSESVDTASYERAKLQAQHVAAVGLTSFLEKRLESAEVTPESVDKTVEELIQEAIGMSAEEYIAQYGPQLLPTMEDLNAVYSHSGSYAVEKGILARTGYGSKTLYEIYSVQDNFLLISAKSDKDEGIEVEEAQTGSIGMAIDATATPSGNGATATEPANISPVAGVVYPLVYTRQ